MMTKAFLLFLILYCNITATALIHYQYQNDQSVNTGKTDEHDLSQSVFIDPRDGSSYNIIQIGEQIWMKENLNYRTENSWCYSNDDEFCSFYGRLYTWESALNACPGGWKLPDNDDWLQLTTYLMNEHGFNNRLEDEYGLGNVLRSCRQVNSRLGGLCNTQFHPRWEQNELNAGRDLFGYSALPGGYRHATGKFADLGYLGHWWSASRSIGYTAHIKSIYRGYSDLRSNEGNVNYAFSVRCLKEKETDAKAYTIEFDTYPVNTGIVKEEMRIYQGKMITIEAMAEDGFRFVSWTNQGKVISTMPNFEFVMPSDNVRLIAHFVPEHNLLAKGNGVVDVDGNVYETIYIGAHEWMAENLKTTHYNDGTPIEHAASGSQSWSDNLTGAFAWYADDPTYKDFYGALYNWHAVNNENGLCPGGWTIPTIEDITAMLNYIDDENQGNIAYELKSCRQIDSPLYLNCATYEHPRWGFHETYYGIDLYGFNGLGAGKKNPDGTFESLGEAGYWWTATKSNIGEVSWYLKMENESSQASRNIISPAYGYSVRCIRDTTEILAESVIFSLDINTIPDAAGVFSGDGAYHSGDSVFVDVTAESGYVFSGWADQQGTIVSDIPDFSFVMPGSNLVLSAIFNRLSEDMIASTISDIEGNIYKTIILDELEWMAENLRTRYYQNGTPIDYPGDNKILWLNNTTGAYAWFNDEDPASNYHGALYNWYAVVNKNGICPYGWRVPAHDDWTKLEQFVCKELKNSMCNIRFPFDNHTAGWRGTNEGAALKITSSQADPNLSDEANPVSHWQKTDSKSANNDFEFNALPAGFRFADGSYFSSDNNAYWWTSSEHSIQNAWIRGITSSPTGIARLSMNKNSAFSIRCVRDISQDQ